MDTSGFEYVTVSEAISAFRISRTTVYQLLASGRIDAVKVGRRTLIRIESVRRFLNECPPFRASG